MAAQSLSIDREFRYIVMWFNEWSELQRDDFVPVLVEYLSHSATDSNGGVYMNGLVNAVGNVGITNKPMSLFQCRIKLFREWSSKWPLDFKQKIQEKIIELDPKVGEKVVNEMKKHSDSHSNGNVVESDEVVTENSEFVTAPITDDIVNIVVANSITDQAIIPDNRLAAVLSNETSVDDDDKEANNDNDTDAQIDIAHVIEPAGQVHEHALVMPAQTALNNTAEVPLVA